MQRDRNVCLWDVERFGKIIVDFTRHKSLAEYENNLLLRSAVERQFTNLGEAVVRLRIHFPDTFAKLTCGREIVRFRNVLTHLYDKVDDLEVWKIVEFSLPVLISEVADLMKEDG